MKTRLSIFALLFVLVLTGCAKDNTETESKMVTVSVTMTSPEDDAATRVSLTPDSGTPQGLILKWETTDKLMLCFEYNANYYHVDANIDPNSISANGKSADFTFAIPPQIPSGATFNLYVVYQKTNGVGTDGGYFQPNTKIYDLEKTERDCITLDQLSPTSQRGISRPMLYFEKSNIINTDNPDIGTIKLIHAGWIMAIHFKNITSGEIDLPEYIAFGKDNVNWVFNGDWYYVGTTSFDFSNHIFSYSISSTQGWLYLNINEDNNSPLYRNRLAPGASIIFYRWVASGTSIPALDGDIWFPNWDSDTNSSMIPARTITYGKTYHVYTTWDGTNFNRTAQY
ncbi:MAG: hypothetical protein ACOX5T_04960 [Candidatus Cryptobacteroides sp.]|jgi:hypothetical protein